MVKRRRRHWYESLETRQLLAGDTLPSAGPGWTGDATSRGPISAEPAATLTLIAPDRYLPGQPLLVRAQLERAGVVDRSQWSAQVTLAADSADVQLSATSLDLVHGMGSVLVTPTGNAPFTLTADIDGTTVSRSLEPLDPATATLVSGDLSGTETTWSGLVRLTGNVVVPEDHTLIIAPGTIVQIDGVTQTPQVALGTELLVRGTLRSEGTLEHPVTITATDSSRPWGELDVDGGTVELTHTIITHAGNSPRGGHTNTGPAIRLHADGSVKMLSSSVTDIRGKIMQATSGALELRDTLLSRAVMGPEIEDTSLLFDSSWIVDMAGRFHHNGTVDDNDGIYLHRQEDGQTIELHRGVVAIVQDDAVDTLGARALLREMIVRTATDKTISVFDGEVTVERTLLADAAIGVETKGQGNSTPDTFLDHVTIADVNRGIVARDKDSPDPNVVISYRVTNTIVQVRPNGTAVSTDYDPADLQVNYSLLSTPWNQPGSGTGNLIGDALFVDAATRDYRLAENSPAIDAGDPNAPADPDGTRSDMGYQPVFQTPQLPGDLNHDGQLDAADIDTICAAVLSGDTSTQFDINGDGQVNSDDHIALVRTAFQTDAGDANLDRIFNSKDMIAVFLVGEYEDTIPGNSGWADGDWNCDGDFTSSDMIAAFLTGTYSTEAQRSALSNDAMIAAAVDQYWLDQRSHRISAGTR